MGLDDAIRAAQQRESQLRASAASQADEEHERLVEGRQLFATLIAETITACEARRMRMTTPIERVDHLPDRLFRDARDEARPGPQIWRLGPYGLTRSGSLFTVSRFINWDAMATDLRPKMRRRAAERFVDKYGVRRDDLVQLEAQVQITGEKQRMSDYPKSDTVVAHDGKLEVYGEHTPLEEVLARGFVAD